MSESEKHEIIGRSISHLKDARRRLAVVNADLLGYSRELQELATTVNQFVKAPQTRNLSGIRLSAHLEQLLDNLTDPAVMKRRIKEVSEEVAIIQDLEKIVEGF